ncbi:PD-(D/E)XK nuclease family protein [Aerococcaceae bacterium DSM 111176]|nr:PD-(D/E)XK nuclease family protein [Aerococcaceae bacterium DSM 111176]
MGFQFILGDLAVDKKTAIIKHVLKIYQQNPNATIYYIVPEHLKFDMESFVLKTIQAEFGMEQSAMINIQVVSFSRLLWFLMPKNDNRHIQISETGLIMLVQQLLSDCADELVVYRGQIRYQGFAKKLTQLFNELYEGHIQAKDLEKLLSEEQLPEADTITASIQDRRIKELMYLYDQFIERVHDLEIADYQIYEDLHRYLEGVGNLPDHYIVIDHYYYFNAHQMNTVIDLARVSEHVWMTLPITEEHLKDSGYEPLYETFKQTYHQVSLLCQQFKIDILPNITVNPQAIFNYHENMVSIAEQFKATQSIGLNSPLKPTQQLNQTHHLTQYDHIQSEVKHVSNQIHQLVMVDGYRYQDILVVTRDMSLYQQVIPAYFNMNNIPYFYDHEMAMAEHPFVQLIETIFNLKAYHGQITDIMSLVKSVLIQIPLQESGVSYDESQIATEETHRLALFENILLKNGYQSYRFTDPSFQWYEGDEILYTDAFGRPTTLTHHQLASYYREFVNNTVSKALKTLGQAFSGREAAGWLYQLISRLQLRESMIQLRDQAIEDGEIELSRRHEQVWEVFIGLLDEFHTLFGDMEMDFDDFMKLMTTGLDEATYHIIPPTLDQVVVTNMESPQTHPAKVCFVLGLDDKTLPGRSENQSLLSAGERHLLREHLLPHQVLADTAQFNNSQDTFLMYQLLLNATEQIYISYSVGNLDEMRESSPFINQLVQTTPLKVSILTDQSQGTRPLVQTDFGRYPMIQQLVMQLYQYDRQMGVAPRPVLVHLMKLLNQYQGTGTRSIYNILTATEKATELPTNIKPETARALFGERLSLSVSNIEQYYQDPYSHFLQYGLRLRERELFEIDTQTTGDYFHDFMDYFTQGLITRNLSLAHLSEEAIRSEMERLTHELAMNYKYRILTSHPRYEAIHQQMNQELSRLIRILRVYDTHVDSKTIATEALFGNNPQYPLKGYTYNLSSGGLLTMRGKIDRIDKVTKNSGSYLEIIDYKSSKRPFNLIDVYYGLDLQILTYLDVALNNYQDAKPLGGFYQAIRQKEINGTQETLTDTESLMEEYLDENRLTGLVTVDEETLQSIDGTLAESNKSQIFPISLKKDGKYMAASSVYTDETLDTLLAYIRYLIKQAGEDMHAGKIALRPFKLERFTPSVSYPWKIIAGFDPTIHYSAYREKNVDKKQAINKMREVLETGEEDGS